MQSTEVYIHPELGPLAILNLLGAAQGILLTLALLSVKGHHKPANRLLAALTLTIAIIIGGSVLLTTDYVFVYPHLSRLHHPFVFLGGPLLFLYIRTLTASDKRFETKDLFHFIPFVCCLLYLLPYYFQSAPEKMKYVETEYLGPYFGHWYYVRSAAFITQFLVYLTLIIVLIGRYTRGVRDRTSPEEQAILFQVRFFVIASLILWVGVVLRFTISYPGTNLLVPLGASVLVYAMGYLEMRRSTLSPRIGDLAPAKKYEKSTLTAERAIRYLDKLVLCMETEKPFTDGDLTVQKLADRLSMSPSHLSQTINERLGQTFSDFINSYRIEEAKRKLVDPACKHLSVLGIAEEVGFNSKSSFNAVFKKHTDTTPSEFRTRNAGRTV